MSEVMTFNAAIAALEELRCFICNGYLSLSPMRFLHNGNYICGRCSVLNTDTRMHRLVTLESVLSMQSFPCIFEGYGCRDMILYEDIVNHQTTCLYQPISCPMNNFVKCVWVGMPLQLSAHFNHSHQAMLKNNVEFLLEVDKHAKGVLMAAENCFPIIVKYFYNPNNRILKYDVRLCSNKNGFGVFYQIQLTNGIESDCNMNLKTNECCLYDEGFLKMQTTKTLNLNKCLEYLGEPDCIVVAVELKVVKPKYDDDPVSEAYPKVNCDLIKSMKCCKCRNYLIPPLFHLDDNVICCDCAKKNVCCKPVIDAELLKCVNEAIYPCRWQYCSVLSKSKNFKNHDMNCQFRLHCCVYEGCDVVFILYEAFNHFQSHKYSNTVYVIGDVTYKTSFVQRYKRTRIISVKNNRIVLIEHQMANTEPPFTHRIAIFTSHDDFAEITGIVVLEHRHCNVKSQEFIVNPRKCLDIDLNELPFCFQEQMDQLSVTIELVV